MQWSGQTDIGKRDENQDSYGFFEHQDFRFWWVADGLGGHSYGKEAAEAIDFGIARSVPDQIGEALRPNGGWHPMFPIRIFRDLQQEVLHTGGMTTLSMLIEKDGEALFAWAGDSPIELLNKGRCPHSGKRSFLSRWSSTPHGAGSYVSRCLGSSFNKAQPQYRAMKVRPQQTVILYSDGMLPLLEQDPNRRKTLRLLVNPANDAALPTQAVQAGGTDNATLVVVRF